MFGEALHIQEMLEHLFETAIPLKYEQDNEAVIKIINNGYSVKMRHWNRVHRVNVASIAEVLEREAATQELRHCTTEDQLANPLTKILPPIQWAQALQQLCIRSDFRR